MPCTLRLAVLAAALSTACASLRAPPPPLTTAKMELERTSSGGLSPFVWAQVAGQRTRLLVDTGAQQSMLSAEIARARSLRRIGGPNSVFMVDAHGNRSPLVFLPDVPVQFEGEAPGKLDFQQSAGPDPELAILVPQELVRPGKAVVIDFRREELRVEPEEAALDRLRRQGPLAELAYSRCGGIVDESQRYVEVAVEGVPSTMALDTGASVTLLARNHPALRKMAAAEGDRRRLAGISSVGQGLLVPAVSIAFGAGDRVLPAVVVPATYPCGDGLLGAEVFRDCAIVWGWSKLWVSCGPTASAQPAATP